MAQSPTASSMNSKLPNRPLVILTGPVMTADSQTILDMNLSEEPTERRTHVRHPASSPSRTTGSQPAPCPVPHSPPATPPPESAVMPKYELHDGIRCQRPPTLRLTVGSDIGMGMPSTPPSVPGPSRAGDGGYAPALAEGALGNPRVGVVSRTLTWPTPSRGRTLDLSAPLTPSSTLKRRRTSSPPPSAARPAQRRKTKRLCGRKLVNLGRS